MDVVFQTFNLRGNYIGKLTSDSFSMYPSVKRLLLPYNKVHTVEPESLSALDSLEMLDLTQNAMKEVPPGLPKSLRWLFLSNNPVKDFENLSQAVGLQTLVLQNCELHAYPDLGVLPNLVELDVAENDDMTELDLVRLANTCRLAKLNVTDNIRLFEPERRGAHCRCRRVFEWASAYKIQLVGLSKCPEPLSDEVDSGGDDDPSGANCTRAPDAALAAFKTCMAEWEHRNTPYWAIGSGLAVVVGLLVLLCVCLCRRRRSRRTGKGLAVASADKENGGAKENSDVKEQLNDAAAPAATGKTDPAALLA